MITCSWCHTKFKHEAAIVLKEFFEVRFLGWYFCSYDCLIKWVTRYKIVIDG